MMGRSVIEMSFLPKEKQIYKTASKAVTTSSTQVSAIKHIILPIILGLAGFGLFYGGLQLIPLDSKIVLHGASRTGAITLMTIGATIGTCSLGYAEVKLFDYFLPD